MGVGFIDDESAEFHFGKTKVLGGELGGSFRNSFRAKWSL
jgi:hypothetical protein